MVMTIHSLRFRLLLMVAAVLTIALGAVAVLLARVVSVEIHETFERRVAPPRDAGRLPSRPPVRAAGPEASINRLRRALLLAALAAGTAGLLLTALLSRRILRPVEALTTAARRMEAGDLDQRVDARGRDEIGDLARAFNAMAERRATAERLRRDLVSDVAHELRSPLTNLRCQIEGLQDGLLQPTPEALRSLAEEIGRAHV